MNGRCRLAAGICLMAPALQAQAQVQAFKLPSGLSCLLLETHDQPLIRMELVTRWEPSEEPAGREGLGGFLAAVLAAGGAGPYGRPDFNRALDDLGVSFSFASRRNSFQWSLATESRSQEPALELLADAVFRPVFDEAMVEGQRQLIIRRNAEASPGNLAAAGFLWRLGDPGTDQPPTQDGFKGLAFADLQAFRRRVVRPEASILAIHGDLSLTQAKELVFLHFGLWGPALPPGPEKAGQAPAPAPKLTVSLDPLSEAELWAGRAPFQGPPAVAELLGLLLEQVPAAAGPGLTLSCGLGLGRPLLIKLKAGPGSRTGLVQGLLDTLEALRTKGFTQAQVDRARLVWKARLASVPLHPSRQLTRLLEGALDPASQARMDALDAREVNAALASLLDPGPLRFLLLGGDAQLVKTLAGAGLKP